MLRTWNGELRLLPNFKFRRFGKKHLRDALQKTGKQEANTAVKKSSDSTESSTSNVEDNKSDIKNSNMEKKELNNAAVPENTSSECSMDIE